MTEWKNYRKADIVRNIFFGIGLVLNIANFLFLFPFILDEYQGAKMGKIGGVFLILYMGVVMFLLLVNAVVMIYFLLKKRHRTVPIFLFFLCIVSFSWGDIVELFIPWESIVSYKIHRIYDTSTFKDLQSTYKEMGNNAYFCVLPEKEFFVLGDYVFNLNMKTYGKLEHDFGFFKNYYNAGSKIKYSDLSQILNSLPYGVTHQSFESMRKLMLSLDLSDVYQDSTLHGTVYAIHSSAVGGTRAIIIGTGLKLNTLLNELNKKGKVLNFETIGEKSYYYHLAPEPIF